MFFSSLLFAVKHDCVFGDDLDIDEITLVSEVHKLSVTSMIFHLNVSEEG